MMDPHGELTFRVASAGDDAARAAVTRLAALDSAAPPAPPYVIAVLDGRPVAARSLSSGATVADPFVRTADVVPLLALRAAQVEAPAAARRARGLGRLVRLRAT